GGRAGGGPPGRIASAPLPAARCPAPARATVRRGAARPGRGDAPLARGRGPALGPERARRLPRVRRERDRLPAPVRLAAAGRRLALRALRSRPRRAGLG